MKRAYFLLLLFPFAASALAQGCSEEAEGQRCSIENMNNDCDYGLTCVPKMELGGQSDICCAPNSTNPACVPGALTTSSSSSSSSSSGTGGGASSSSSSTGMGGAGGGQGGGSGGGGKAPH